MAGTVNALIISEKDSVAVATEALKAGDVATFMLKGEPKEITILTDVPIYHKFAVVDIKEGDQVYKYGQSIGRATQDIKVGEHVHSHNLVSIREAISNN